MLYSKTNCDIALISSRRGAVLSGCFIKN